MPVFDQIEHKRLKKKVISTSRNDIKGISGKQTYSKYKLISEILSFIALKNNWDGFGAIPLEIYSATNVIVLMDLIGEEKFCTLNEMFPNPNGTISLTWNNKSDETISMEIGNETLSYYVALSSKKTLFFNDIKINWGDNIETITFA